MSIHYSQPPLVETYVPKPAERRHSYILRDLRPNITYDVVLYGRNKYGNGRKVDFQFRTSHGKSKLEPTIVVFT